MVEEEQLPAEMKSTCLMNLNRSLASPETLGMEQEGDVTRDLWPSSLSVTQHGLELVQGPFLLCQRSTRKAKGFSHSVS